MKTKLLVLFLSCSFISLVYGQSKRSLFDFDYAQFAYDSTSNYVELYYSLNQSALAPQMVDGGKYVESILKITIADTSADKPVVDKEWLLKQPVDANDSLQNKSLVGQLAFVVPNGKYKCTVQVKDKFNEKNEKTIYDKLIVNPYSVDSLAVSDIQLSSRIVPNSTDKKSMFYKNTFEVTPIPTAVFGETVPAVFYYYEVYEKEKTQSSSPFMLYTTITNSKGKILYSNAKKITRNVASRAEVGVVPINKYPTDAYNLKIAVLDSVNNYGIGSTKRFFVYNPSVKSVDTMTSAEAKVLSSSFGVLSSEECDDLFAKSKYIALPAEIEQYNKLTDLNAKRGFLYQFWQKRDTDPSTPQNEYYQEYMKRVDESNKRFSSMVRTGWKTDRGRVLIMYGEPSEIDRYPNQDNTKPYIIWKYNDIEGGVEFDFADMNGFSDYELVSSTKRGEIYDANWQSRISAN